MAGTQAALYFGDTSSKPLFVETSFADVLLKLQSSKQWEMFRVNDEDVLVNTHLVTFAQGA